MITIELDEKDITLLVGGKKEGPMRWGSDITVQFNSAVKLVIKGQKQTVHGLEPIEARIELFGPTAKINGMLSHAGADLKTPLLG